MREFVYIVRRKTVPYSSPEAVLVRDGTLSQLQTQMEERGGAFLIYAKHCHNLLRQMLDITVTPPIQMQQVTRHPGITYRVLQVTRAF